MKLAVIGKDVSQSSSPQMHTFIFGALGKTCTYDKISIPPEEIHKRAEALFEAYDAFNVTIPFKGDIIQHLNGLEGDAQSFGAVNTVLSKTRKGYNTDGYGFLLMLENEGIALKGRSVLVLGAGGAGRSCIKKLTEAGAKVFAFERSAERLHAIYEEFGGFTPLESVPVRPFDLVLNCTGIGMHDTVGKTPSVTWENGSVSPVGKELLSLCDTAIDLIYVPAQSEFLRIAKECGKRTVNGAAMLFYQAYMADCIYLNRAPNADEAKKLYERYREEYGI
ncbi:MAG: shikimate dehydrogenase [Clostridiales bacterium]|nr:shikimate dehydrogenase [Clostridiales bacterium]